MNINELSEDLKRPFSQKRGYGITKLKNSPPEWANIYFVVPKAPPKEITSPLPYALLSEALKITHALPSLDKMSELDKLINYLFIRREVVQSSRLEGTWSTIDHALTPGELADKNEGKDVHQAVRSYANIIEEIITQTQSKKEKVFTKKFVNKIHKSIIENDPNSSGRPGKLREEGKAGAIVTIGGAFRPENSIFNPPPASYVDQCLDEVLNWFQDEELAQLGDAAVGGLSLPIRIAIGHAHFEAVHPYSDGNGRTGRALWPAQMVASGHMPLYLSGYVEMNKSEYTKSLEEAQKKLNYFPLTAFICQAIIESSLENEKTKKAILELEDLWQERGSFREKSGAKRALRLLLSKPIISTSILEKELGLSKTASVDTINSLCEKKIIRKRGVEKRMRIYAAEELIQILSRPFGSDIDLAIEKAQVSLGI